MIRPPSDTVILNQVRDDGIRGKRFSTLLQRRYRGELLFV
jgi:hypothetical protein